MPSWCLSTAVPGTSCVASGRRAVVSQAPQLASLVIGRVGGRTAGEIDRFVGESAEIWAPVATPRLELSGEIQELMLHRRQHTLVD